MSFSSFEYIFCFLPVVALGFWFLVRRGLVVPSTTFLCLASLVFYALGDLRGLPFLLLSAGVNGWLGQRLSSLLEPSAKRRLLRLGLALNVALLVSLKYWAFLLGALGWRVGQGHGWHVPIGISFFTLIQIMYLIDCYEGLAKPHTLGRHLLFTSLFPYVTMGPLVRAKDLPEHLGEATAKPTERDVARGLELFVIGLFKKAVFAQSLGTLADAGWGLSRGLSAGEAWLTTLAFAFELYFDFSGYTDMALGSALLLGVKLPANFDAPYKATSIIAFWKRWHITLSAFITTYLYTPLLRLRRRPGFAWAMTGTVLSMVLAGLWHGAAWTFVLFGLLHGLALVLNHLWRRRKLPFPALLGWLLTFGFVACTLVLFRAPNVAAAGRMFQAMVVPLRSGFDADAFVGSAPALVRAFASAAAVVLCLFAPTSGAISDKFEPSYRRLAVTVLLTLLALLFMNSLAAKEFIYRDF